MRMYAEGIGGFSLPFESFDTVINGLDIKHKKPAPGIFLLAAKQLGLEPKDCLIVEDAVNGVEAAKDAGMTASAALQRKTFPKQIIMPKISAAYLPKH